MQTCPRCKQQTVSTQPVEMEDAGGVGIAWVCETCHAALTGRFFSDRPLRETTTCPFGHPITPENSPRVGWVTCPTCLEATALPRYRPEAPAPRTGKFEQLRLL
jgi:hypothetical protein